MYHTVSSFGIYFLFCDVEPLCFGTIDLIHSGQAFVWMMVRVGQGSQTRGPRRRYLRPATHCLKFKKIGITINRFNSFYSIFLLVTQRNEYFFPLTQTAIVLCTSLHLWTLLFCVYYYYCCTVCTALLFSYSAIFIAASVRNKLIHHSFIHSLAWTIL